MSKRKLFSFLLLFILAIMIGCSSEDEAEGKTEPERDEEPEEEEVVETETNDQEEKEEEQEPAEEEQLIEGEVTVIEDENIVRVELDTNLVENTVVEVNMRKAYGELSSPIGRIGSENGEVKNDGTITIDYPLDDDFFERYKGEKVEVKIEIKGSTFQENVVEAYGKQGEKFTGPFVYQYDRVGHPDQRLYIPVYFQVGDEQTIYTIETPEREPLPDDYGNTKVWMDVEIIDNDHRYLYVRGKSNLLEGLVLQGRYFEDADATFAQEWATEMFVEPDGTFVLPVKYESITSDGYIEIQGAPVRSHRTKKEIHKTYGEDFEHLTGDIVKEVDDHQEILITIDNEGLDIDTPEDSLITEDDGELKIQVPDDVLFDFDKSDLKSEAKNTLDDVIAILEDLDEGEDIQIHGHTDNEGEPDYNLNLSEERAASVEEYLTKHGDLNHLNITKEGFGETKPVESNEDEEGRKRNRRVEIIFNNE